MTVLTQRDASVFIQFRLGDREYYLGDCTDLDTIPNPRLGGVDYIYCWNAKRNGFVKKGKKLSPPGNIEVTLTQMMEETQSWLDKVRCPFILYAMKRNCSDAGVFKNWVRGAILYEAELTGDELSAYGHHLDDNETLHAFTVSAPTPRVDVWKLVASRVASALVTGLDSVAPCMNLYCDDDCGAYSIPGDNVIAGEDSGYLGGAPGVILSGDAAATWALSATSPFTAGDSVMSLACFEIGKGVNRLLAVRDTKGATVLQAAYSDDGGATWTLVDVGAITGEGTTGPKSLVAIDSQHIWIVTDEPTVYFSGDGGETWDIQPSAAAGANPLNAISYADVNTLVAVGDNDTIIYTIDGGANWVAAGATGSGDDLLSIQCFNPYRWLVGTDGAAASTSSLFITYDSGDTWEERSFVGKDSEEVTDMSFATPGVGIIITNTAGPVGSIHLTIDGGFSWEEISPPANSGFNAVAMVDTSTAYIVGHPNGGTSMIVKVGV
jgi:photosystem II stability/assembly factor-like uncharacterized protein